MPHDASKYLGKDYQERKQSKIDADPEDCRSCGNEECVEAFEEKKMFEMEEGIK